MIMCCGAYIHYNATLDGRVEAKSDNAEEEDGFFVETLEELPSIITYRDPKTKAWLDEHKHSVFGFPTLVRFSWGTCIPFFKNMTQVLWESELDKDDGSADKTSKKNKKHKLEKGSANSGIEIVGSKVDEDGKMDEVPDLVPNNDMVSEVDTECSNGLADKGSKKTKKGKKASGETKSSKKKKNETTDSDALEFEKVAAEVEMDVDGGSSLGSPHTPVNGTLLKERKTTKSSNGKKDSRGEGVNENSDVGKSGGTSVKKVKFQMNSNLVWKPHSLLPPQSVRVPPSATPRGSALKKGVPVGPVREMPKMAKLRSGSAKKARKSPRLITPTIKQLKKLRPTST
ncbi:hypothetical protein GIB67_039828 [Kingdonia uniflora]|uniref:Uncharacterized protein n=1 Tax=Kingdonia uniflora TaxID=39325 RepID=A0A7J7P346_9MAGN|nr:hypothetical protein GIB67_039828 [Kingdonia uniflora]